MYRNYILRNIRNFKVSVRFQDFTNFISSQGFSCHFSEIQRAGHSFTCSLTFSFALLECPHLHNLHWKANFLHYSAFSFFLLRIPKWSTGSTSTTQNPTVNGIYICIDVFYKIFESWGNSNQIIEPLAPFLLITRHVLWDGKERMLEGFVDCFWFHILNCISYNA